MIETVILAMIFAKVKGYNIKPVFNSWEFYPVIFMELIIIIAQINIFLGNYFLVQYSGILKTTYLCTYLFIIFKHEIYIKAIIGSAFIVLGGLLNDIAIKSNSGMMPVFPALSYLTGYAKVDSFSKVNDIHVLGSSSVKYICLTDIFDLGYSILSIGDIFIRVFVFIIIYAAIKKINESRIIKL
ncbi:DUF5317 family protein [Clostridium cylindrosporum]|uniref:Putative membrane protein n=1 Tax=Clostridium cylindrosporum DSM 605 TaxID=1121307 RepID=A0A0J8G6F9_CLOCY|nr:DUF5317 family protein [Clostridium cylindrosporum]KMT23191.1 putative membrane protein [Clostridium cylindrosporum DSM 605]